MIKNMLCIALLVLASQGAKDFTPNAGVVGKLPGGPNCGFYEWGNGDVFKNNVNDWQDCKDLCKNAPEAEGFECDAVIYKDSASRCWILGPDCDMLDIDAGDDAKKSSLLIEYDEATEWCLMDEFTSSQTCSADHHLAQFDGSVSELEDCKSFCALHETCKYFFFNDDNHCKLYTDCSIDDARIPGTPGDTYGKGSCATDVETTEATNVYDIFF